MHLSPADTEKLLLSVAGMVARDRLARGVLLNHPESVALLSTWVIERAREVSDERPGGFTSPTPLNDVFRRGRPDSDEYVFSADDAKDWSDEA